MQLVMFDINIPCLAVVLNFREKIKKTRVRTYKNWWDEDP